MLPSLVEWVLSSLTVIHHYVITRRDGTTADERFATKKHENLFAHLVAIIPTPARPRVRSREAVEPMLVARYTWEEIRARVRAADAKTLARYPVAATLAELIKEGAALRSERILTDLRLWLDDIVAWWSKLTPEERAATVGFSDARLQVVTHHAFALIGLVRRASKSHAKSDHAAAADTAASDAAALDRTLGALVELARGRSRATVGLAQRQLGGAGTWRTRTLTASPCRSITTTNGISTTTVLLSSDASASMTNRGEM